MNWELSNIDEQESRNSQTRGGNLSPGFKMAMNFQSYCFSKYDIWTVRPITGAC